MQGIFRVAPPERVDPRRLTKLRIEPEQSVQTFLIEGIKALGGYAAKITGESGTPDVLGTLPWLPGFIVEVKRTGEEPEPHQYVNLAQWLKGGMPSTWVAGKLEAMAFLDFLNALPR